MPGAKVTGGKGHNLLVLKREGYNVPDFVIIPVDYFKTPVIKEELLPEIQGYFNNTVNAFAVRSSAVAEDGSNFSFAGQFSTKLNVSRSELIAAIFEVHQSAKEVAASYLDHSGEQEMKMAVIVQQMIPATVSGVAFGANPMTGATDEIVINAVQGLGEALVSGSVNADTYTVTGSNIERETVNNMPVLNDAQIQTVTDTVRSLAQTFGTPQDIEFAFADDEFFLLQSRPVTSVYNTGERIVWDNSNIIESYPGLTLPLTFSFIEKMYAAVYRQLSVVLGVQQYKVDIYTQVYDNMLGLLNGRVYYNLNSWYAALSLLPGYKLNAEYMEKMMGVKEKANVDLVTKDEFSGKRVLGYFEVLRAAKSLLYNLRSVRRQKKEFVHDFDKVYNLYVAKNYSEQTIAGIYKDYLDFERMMVTKWKAPLVNDFFAMIYFGVLQKMCAKYFPAHPDIHNQLVASSQDIVTVQPMIRLPRLAQTLAGNTELKEALLQRTSVEVWQLLNTTSFKKELKEVQQYLDDWGERCVAELKLETITYKQEPERLITVLQTYIKQGSTHAYGENNAMRSQAEDVVKNELQGKWLKKKLFGHVLRQARYLVSNRENLRYYRTKGFGVVRNMMLTIGNRMKEDGILADERDVFYLRLDEVGQVAEGELSAVAAIIAERKRDYELFNDMPLPERVETYGKQDKIIQTSVEGSHSAKMTELKGIGCCPGIVRAKVCKVSTINAVFPDNEILVTYATDPGYVVMFPSSTGILTERGSLLSHAAIVSREMNIPCIVGIDGVMEILNHGDEIIMDGSTGVVKILHQQNTGYD